MAKQFLNSMYKGPKRGYDSVQRKYVSMAPDVLIYTTKDTETLKSELHVVEHPKISFYLSTKPQPFHKISIPISDARKIKVPYADRDKEIATCLGCLDAYYNSSRNGSGYEYKKQVLKNPNLYMADTDIEDYFKTCMIMKEGEHIADRYNMAFSDIEVDISNLEDDFPEPSIAPCPVNLITAIYAETKEVLTYMLYDERIKNEIADIANDNEKFVNTWLDEDIKKEGFTFHINAYATELDLLKAYFYDIHQRNPDFMAWWNMPFDIPTILNRFKRLGLNDEQIAQIVCSPEVPDKFKYYRYKEDPKRELYNKTAGADDDDEEDDDNGASKNSKNKPHPSRLIDWVEIPGYTQHYDQLSLFSNLRKRTLYPSYKLDVIGEEFAGQRKLNLEDAGYNIKDVNVKNFYIFVAYNIRDVFVQYVLEKKQRDMYQNIVFSDNTRLSKSQQQSIVIKNKLMIELLRDNQIMGNAIDYDVVDKVPGAVVGRPELIEKPGIPICGKPSYVFENAVDFDYSSLYPSATIMFNIFKSSLFGHVTDVRIPNNCVPEGFESLGDGEGLFESLLTIDQSIFDVASDYMGLPKPEDLVGIIAKYACDCAIGGTSSTN